MIMKRTILIAATLMLTLTTSLAVPAWRQAIKTQQPDGTWLTFYLTGDEHSHQCLTTDGYRLLQDAQGSYRYARLNDDGTLTTEGMPLAHNIMERTAMEHTVVALLPLAHDIKSQQKDVRKAPKQSNYQIEGFPTKGTIKCLVILAEFSNVPFTFNQDFHQRMMNEQGFSDDNGTGSASEYFTDQSMQTFFPQFDVVGPVPLRFGYAYYGQDNYFTQQDEDTGLMIVEACQTAHDQFGVDFSQYDNDGNGEVDMVYVIFSGYGQNSGAGSDAVWPKKYTLSANYHELQLDNKKIDMYACSAELFGNSEWSKENGTHSAGIGTVCHEFGHVLGFTDHYNTQGTDYRLGSYDEMDYGPYNNNGRTPPAYNAFERMSLGWLRPDTLRNDPQNDVMLEHIATSNKAIILTTSNKDEFYLLENRQQEGWDKYIPSSGLMITHLDFDYFSWAMNVANTDNNHKRFYLVCADNEPVYDYLTGLDSERGDLYPSQTTGNNRFTDTSLPAAKPYTGETLDKWVTNIQNIDGIVTFDYQNNHLESPKNVQVSHVGETEFTLQWDAVERADRYEANLYRLMYESERPVALAEGFWKMEAGTVSQPDGLNISETLDNYTMQAGWTGENVYQAGGICKIGSAGVSGRLTTPQLNLSTADGNFGVYVKVQSAQTKTPVFSISSNGQTARTRLASSAREYYAQFQGGLPKSIIDFGSVNERAFIDTIVIVRGTQVTELFPQAKAISVSGDITQTDGGEAIDNLVVSDTTIVENIASNSFTFTGLERGVNYCVELRAMNNDMGSSYSTLIYVLTGTQEQGIEPLDASQSVTVADGIYDLQGRRWLNGQLPRGIFIERQGTQSRIKTVK